MGPDGALYAVDTGSTVTQMVRRAPVRFRSKLQGSPQELYATMTGALLARVGRQGARARGARAPTRRRCPRRCPSEADRAELLRRPGRGGHRYRGRACTRPRARTPPKSIRLSGPPAWRCCSRRPGIGSTSPRTDDELLVLDRYSGDRLAAIDLPGPAKGASRRPLRAVAPGAAGRRRLGLGDRRRPRAVRRRGGRQVGRPTCRPSRRPTRCWSAAGKRCRRHSISAPRASPRPVASRDGAGDEWLPVAVAAGA